MEDTHDNNNKKRRRDTMGQVVGVIGIALLSLFMAGYARRVIPVSEGAFGFVIGAGCVAIIAVQVFLTFRAKQKKASQS
jgi:hypothetical protein